MLNFSGASPHIAYAMSGPGCPLKCGSGSAVVLRGLWLCLPAPARAWGFLRSPPPGGKPSACPSPHNRSHPWCDNKVRAINRASTMEYPALVGISGFF